MLITGLEDQFNGWLEYTLMCFVNEIQVNTPAEFFKSNPINILCDEYNAAVKAYNATQGTE